MAPPCPLTSGAAGTLSRRRLLQLALAHGAATLVPVALGGCGRQGAALLLAARGGLPSAWLERLPSPWHGQLLHGVEAVVRALDPAAGQRDGQPALVSLPDGWAIDLPLPRLQPFGAPGVLGRLAAAAQPVSRLYRPEGQPALAFPWAFSPWVIVLRSQPALAERARGPEGWGVLAAPALKGRLVLPSSPRVAIEIRGGYLDRLHSLRAQALAYNDSDALNLLLSGEAAAAVVPLQRLIPLLRRDQRLEVVWPSSGAPLSWQLLLRPEGAAAEPPLEWLGALLEPPLLPRLLAGGWVPPLPRPALAAALARLPQPLAELLLPPDAVLQRCWSLPPLDPERRLTLQTLWDAAAPP
jgi:putative spermidine/putrescine transport system substrate-binding protein